MAIWREDRAGEDRHGDAAADNAGFGGRNAGREAGGEEGLAAAGAVGFRPPALDEGGDDRSRQLNSGGGEGVRVGLLAVERLMRWFVCKENK